MVLYKRGMETINRIKKAVVSLSEAAEILSITPQRVGQLIKEGQLHGFYLGGKKFLLRKHVIIHKRAITK